MHSTERPSRYIHVSFSALTLLVGKDKQPATTYATYSTFFAGICRGNQAAIWLTDVYLENESR